MAKLSYNLLSIFLLLSICALGQRQIQIKGKFKPSTENTKVSVYTPIAGNFNMALPDDRKEVDVENSFFGLEVSIDKPGFIRLQSKMMPRTYFFAEPGGKIEISFIKDKLGNFQVMYSGSNSEANNLLANNSPMNNQNFLQHRLPEIFQVESAQKLVEVLYKEIEESTFPFRVMLKKGKITKQCYQAMIEETEQTTLHWVNTYLKNFLMPDNELPYVTKLSREEVKKLAEILYSKYDPYNSKYSMATRTYNNQMIKSILIEDGAIPETRVGEEILPVWSEFGKEFSMLVSRLSAIDHAPDTVQMNFIGTSLLSALAFKPMSDSEFLKVFHLYQTKFPNSPFNLVINKHLDKMPEEGTTGKETSEVYVWRQGSDSLSSSGFVDVDKIKNIKELVKKYFSGKMAFVDFWATWCSPCIAEFQNEPALHAFLEARNIATLYVSIDSPNAFSKWKRAIGRYQLSGYHYLAKADIRDNLDKWFFGIPRYMLFDSNGEIVDDNLPKPSSKEEFFEKITQALKK